MGCRIHVCRVKLPTNAVNIISFTAKTLKRDFPIRSKPSIGRLDYPTNLLASHAGESADFVSVDSWFLFKLLSRNQFILDAEFSSFDPWNFRQSNPESRLLLADSLQPRRPDWPRGNPKLTKVVS